ncbi:MAG: Gfo/Idh/MocA family oxidoreductase [Firmicutes bacterium]|nr:Gfo/Idh/MocA family oxidoreductase [Bacillota bacterium]
MSSKHFSVGIAGAGAFATFLAEALAPLPAFSLSAVAGHTPSKRDAVLAAYRKARPQAATPRQYDTAEALIGDPHVEIVLIVTPPATHAEFTAATLQAGKHAFVEKPGALSAAQLEQNRQLAASTGRALAVDLVMRHHPLTEAVQQLLSRCLVGEVEHVTLVNAVHHVKSGHWFWDKRQSGGIFTEHGVHFFEVARHWFGEAETASGSAQIDGQQEESRVWATACHQAAGVPPVPVQYYHGFTRAQEVPEQTEWRIETSLGRITLTGWIPEKLEIEAALTPAQIEAVDTLLQAIPQQPSPFLQAAVQEVGSSLQKVDDAGSPRWIQRTTICADRQGWYNAMVQARFLDLCRAIDDPGYEGLITLQDAVADLALAERCRV